MAADDVHMRRGTSGEDSPETFCMSLHSRNLTIRGGAIEPRVKNFCDQCPESPRDISTLTLLSFIGVNFAQMLFSFIGVKCDQIVSL